jgi:spermidine/putrescine transport system ATP-binding protein
VAGSDVLEITTAQGLRLHARPGGAALADDGAGGGLRAGDPVSVYVRPEAMTLQRVNTTAVPAPVAEAGANVLVGQVASLLFDGANSAVLVRLRPGAAAGSAGRGEAAPDAAVELRVALPQTGQFADLQAGETVACRFDADRALAFHHASA